ncbi:MAG TPA: DUF5130 family protein [Frankiaceae bacterium]|nr:DUF5130 family protein [Frankiaceae bacterium]
MAAGEAFTREQHERIERARRAAEGQTGMRFWLRVGEFDRDPKLEAEHLLTNLIDGPRDSAVLILVAPGSRVVEIMTTHAAKRRITDQAAGLVVLTMTSSFGVGDLVGGLVNALRQLADAAGRRAQEDALAIEGVPAG